MSVLATQILDHVDIGTLCFPRHQRQQRLRDAHLYVPRVFKNPAHPGHPPSLGLGNSQRGRWRAMRQQNAVLLQLVTQTLVPTYRKTALFLQAGYLSFYCARHSVVMWSLYEVLKSVTRLEGCVQRLKALNASHYPLSALTTILLPKPLQLSSWTPGIQWRAAVGVLLQMERIDWKSDKGSAR